MIFSNTHMHTRFSDGTYMPEEIIRFAIKHGLSYIGFSEHIFCFKPSLFTPKQIDNYVTHLNEMKLKYPEISISAGGELDIQQLERTTLSLLDNFDYLNIEYMNKLSDFKKIEKIRRFYDKPLFLVHTLFSGHPYDDYCLFRIDKKKYKNLIDKLVELEVGIELTDGLRNLLVVNEKVARPYFHFYEDFFDLVREKLIPVSVGTDVHDSLNEVLNTGYAMEFIQKKELETNYSVALSLFKNN